MLSSSLSAMDQQNTTTNSSSGGGGDGSNSSSSVWHRVLRPSVVLAVGSPVVLLVNIGLVIVFLLRQNWHGIILCSIAFIAWTQVIYWFFRARTLLQPRSQVNGHVCCCRLHLTLLNVSADRGMMEGSGRCEREGEKGERRRSSSSVEDEIKVLSCWWPRTKANLKVLPPPRHAAPIFATHSPPSPPLGAACLLHKHIHHIYMTILKFIILDTNYYHVNVPCFPRWS